MNARLMVPVHDNVILLETNAILVDIGLCRQLFLWFEVFFLACTEQAKEQDKASLYRAMECLHKLNLKCNHHRP